MKDRTRQERPAAVPERAPQAGETLRRWEWVEESVWTERMLAALEEGVKGGVWARLYDKVFAEKNMYAAWLKVRKRAGAAGIDGIKVKEFEKDTGRNIDKLKEELQQKRYQPKAVRRVHIPKAGGKGTRPLGIPTVRDRIVQTALKNVIEPIYEREFSDSSYGFRPRKGCKDALRQVDEKLREGYVYVIDADIRSYFDTIPHKQLMEKIKEKVADGSVLRLIEMFLEQGIMEGMKEWQPEEGTPQGAVISPLLANIYLNGLDHKMNENGYKIVRYADDFVVLCKSKEEAMKAYEEIRKWMKEAGLELNNEKTRIVDMSEAGAGFDFLGYHFEKTKKSGRIARRPRKKSMQKFKDSIREITRRNNGLSMLEIITKANQKIQGWYEYFKHSNKGTFKQIDSWIRMRLRSILRKRSGRTGIGDGYDNIRWPNAYFTEYGLTSLVISHIRDCQSARR